MEITWDAKISATPQEISKLMRSGKPAIVVAVDEDRPGLAMNSFMLQPGEDKIVAEQLSRVLREHSA